MNLNWLGRTIRMLLQVWHETEGHFIVGTVILGFLTIFKRCQASSTFVFFFFFIFLFVVDFVIH